VTPKLPRRPDVHVYRDIPVSNWSSWDVNGVRNALDQHELGQFYASAQYCDFLLRDDRVSSALGTRVRALCGLPFKIEPAPDGDGRTTRKIARSLESARRKMFPRSIVADILRWSALMGFCIAELIWDTTGDQWMPSLKIWHPQFIYYRLDTRSYWASTMDGVIEITPGDGKWFLYAPHGAYRGWMRGAVRSISILALLRQYALRDWARASEMYGMGVRLGYVPADCDPLDRNAFISQLNSLGSESVLLLPQGMNDKDGFDFDVKMAGTGGFNGELFERLGHRCDMGITLELLGQNLTSEVQEGSLAAARVHGDVRQDYLEFDAATLAEDFRNQVVAPWAVFNFTGATADDAPLSGYDATPPEDVTAGSAVFGVVATGIAALQTAGVLQVVDLEALGEKFSLPMSANVADIIAATPPAPPGDIEPPPTHPADVDEHDKPSGSPGVTASRVTLGRAPHHLAANTKGQMYIDRVADAAVARSPKAMRATLDAVLDIIKTSRSYDQIRVRLVKLAHAHGDTPEFDDLVERAIALSVSAGGFAVANEAEPVDIAG